MTQPIGLLNYATVPLPCTMQQLQEALQEYAGYIEAAWGSGAEVLILEDVPSLASGIWPLFLADTTNVTDAAAYHTLASTGQPWGVAFVQTDEWAGIPPSEAVAHELAELLLDPTCATVASVDDVMYSREICDPVQEATFVAKNGLTLPDFVCPAWYGVGGVKYDYLGLCTRPAHILPGGYATVLLPGQGWQTVVGDAVGAVAAARKLGTENSRLRRRLG